MKKISLLLFFALSIKTMAQDTGKSIFSINDVFLGGGSLTQFVGKVQTDESGSKNSFDFLPYIGGGVEFHLHDSFSLIPQLAISFPRSGRDENIKKLTYWFQFPVAYRLEKFQLSFGPGLLYNRISSSGGTQSIRNGTGTTEFPLPNGSSISSNLTLNLGLDWTFYQDISAKFETWIVNLSDSESRSYSYAISAYYHFGEIKW
ncbi:hypothetical protein BIY24_10400 [Halobacteriovorax marinus]|uniref:hypothetical protein n=1 Tax=Halobacteriovorax marinus TaxID=97084 RepID=UPI000BC2D77F|nr:hypothetical protein [Halobacteriovorax marinus]ATH08343.1 hypothetical protein BIY24_10400 [Halobacteriovorax marinus]